MSTAAAAPGTTRYIVVCRGPHCRERGSLPLRKRLAALLKGDPHVRLVGYSCFGQCELGPNVAFFPEGVWFGGLSQPDAAERVARHAQGIHSMELDQAPLQLPDAERRQHVSNVEELIATLERDLARPRRWWWPF